ncbi:MAG: hypothetical protein QG597_4784 [Actinomycetota bacterium]|jgi:hypothetical protein|nr:hypothetical protein [Actinomycetota bacterium]
MDWNALSAIAAACGVIVAAVLGFWAVRLAGRTVDRSELNYLAGRADQLLQTGSKVSALIGEYKAALHVFWKEDPLVADVGDADRRQWLVQARAEGEVEAHKLDYLLIGASAEFRAQAKALTEASSDSANRGEEAIRRAERATVLLVVIRNSLRAQYMTLIPSAGSGLGSGLAPAALEMAFVDQILEDVSDSLDWGLRTEIKQWFNTEIRLRVEAGERQDAPEILAIDFQELYLDPKWEEAYTSLTSEVHRLAMPDRGN